MFSGFSQSKCKTQCQLLAGRIRLMRNKRQVQLKNSRRQVADLLRNGKAENARIRVESVMREEQMLQAYEVIELFVELLTVRIQLIDKQKEIPGDMIEAISSLVYAAQRITDLPELQAIRGMLGSKYGKEYIAEASSDTYCRKWVVNENLIRCLAIDAPAAEDKLACLSEIAQEHGVEWDAAGAAADMLPSRRGAAPYLAGDRTTYSDPRGGPAAPYPPPPPAGGGGSGYGGGHGGGRTRGGGSGGGYYGSHGAPPSARHTAADIAGYAAGPRSKAEEEDEGIVKYPSAGPRSMAQAPRSKAEDEEEGIVQYPSAAGPRSKAKEEEEDEEEGIVKYPSAGPRATAAEEEDEEEGVVDYPAVGAGSRRGAGSAEQKDLTGPDGLGDPSDWDPPPREIPHAGPRRGGGAAASSAKPYTKTQPAGERPAPRVSVPPPVSSAAQQPGGSPAGGLSVSPNSRWAPPPGTSPRRDTGSHLDAVARWKYQRENPGAARASQSPQSPGGEGQPWGGAGPATGAPGGGGAGKRSYYNSAPDGPPAKPEYKRQGPSSAPSQPPPADDLSLPTPPRAASPAPAPTELDDLQERFAALKRR